MHREQYKGFSPDSGSVEPLNSTELSPRQSDNSNEEQLDHLLAGYDYQLPPERIAQNPAVPRDSARLLVISPTDHTHQIFRDLPSLLLPGDLLVMNNTRVIPARLYGRKSSGAAVEALLVEERQPNTWLALVKPGRRLQPGARIFFERQGRLGAPLGDKGQGGERGAGEQGSRAELHSSSVLSATVLEIDEATGGRLLQFDVPAGVSLIQLLDSFGHVPLPPYITDSQADLEQYQTVYAQQPGAVAAPTAGLHFTPSLLEQLQQRGIGQAFVTLHVGVGTFRPVEVEDVKAHQMHGEWVEVSAETVQQICETQNQGGRIIAVGTTAVRALEGAAQSGQLQPFCGKTNLFIYPGYQWRVVEGLITNFHLPRSSLLMLVSALIGRQRLLALYTEVIASEYRFYSFGDAMLILPAARTRD
jgi:S-adenosylmethionine:tRNA ribosyltransferase-isomerase